MRQTPGVLYEFSCNTSFSVIVFIRALPRKINMPVLPKNVPTLSAKNMFIGSRSGPNNTHCLLGWVDTVFGDSHNQSGKIVCDILRSEIRKETSQKIGIMSYNDCKVDANNKPLTESFMLKRAARLWNRVMAKLGYEMTPGSY